MESRLPEEDIAQLLAYKFYLDGQTGAGEQLRAIRRQRNKLYCDLRGQGYQLSEIADIVGCSNQRIGQIVKRAGGPTPGLQKVLPLPRPQGKVKLARIQEPPRKQVLPEVNRHIIPELLHLKAVASTCHCRQLSDYRCCRASRTLDDLLQRLVDLGHTREQLSTVLGYSEAVVGARLLRRKRRLAVETSPQYRLSA